ncbi:MAG: UbiA family prenyltransferase, partial [Dehalococcoidales bacterium]|nr:UbiA family prenyltransferase [Dehalococcoidales bacterium]
LYGLVVFAGVFFDTVVYTVWLKRRTPWSIVWGGIAGAMPVLAGRVLAAGQFDLIGLLLAMSVLFWIPTHIITFSFRQAEDYKRAGVPVFPNCYGERTAHLIISISTVIAVLCLVIATMLIGLDWGYLRAILSLSILLIIFAVASMLRRSDKFSFALFKMASFYMLVTMVVIIVGMWSNLTITT